MKKNILLKCTGASDPFATAGKKATVIGWVNVCPGENFSIVPRDKSGKIIPMEIEVPARDIPELIKSLSDLYSNYQQDKPWLPTLEQQRPASFLQMDIKYLETKDRVEIGGFDEYDETRAFSDDENALKLAQYNIDNINTPEEGYDTPDITAISITVWRMKLNQHGAYIAEERVLEWEKSGDTPGQQEPARSSDGSNSMDIRVGGKYLTRGGKIAEITTFNEIYQWSFGGNIDGYFETWSKDGRSGSLEQKHENDLIAEITEE